MQFRILGPLEVWEDGVELPLGGPRTRALLALLLLHANEVVSADRLIDELWGEDSSETASTALRVNVSRLRKALAADVLVTRAPGYAIRVEPDELDLARFERLVDEARELLSGGELTGASERLRQALGLWRGPALADLAYASFTQGAIARLEEIRLAALELRIETDLALGRARELVAELRACVAEHPLRERLVAFLMTALYQTDRQGEALAVFRQARRTLVDELGIEPGASLQGLERAILQQDPALLAAALPAISGDGERSVLVAIANESCVDALLAIAEPLARHPPRVLVLARLVGDAAALAPTTAWLAERASALRARGLVVRTASFTTMEPGADLARLASDLAADLLLTAAPDGLLRDGVPGSQLVALLAGTPCDVALLAPQPATPTGGVLVPFGGADHDWAAVELGAWFARAQRRAAAARGGGGDPGGWSARREPSALARRPRGAARARRRLRAAAGRGRRGGPARGESRRRPARGRPVHEVAPAGPRGGPPATGSGRPAADPVRAAGTAPRRSRAARGADALHVVDPRLTGVTRCTPARTAAPGGSAPTPRARACGSRWRTRAAPTTRGSMSQTTPRPSPCGHEEATTVGRHVDLGRTAPAAQAGADSRPAGDVPQRGHRLEARDGERGAVGAEVERQDAGAAMVELAEEPAGAGRPGCARSLRSRPSRRSRRPG